MATPWLGLFGDLDAMIPPDHVERLRSEMADKAQAPSDIVRYADADHGFHCDARPDSFNADAARDGWARALAWFGTHLG